MTERNFVVRDPMFFTWTLNEVCLIVSGIKNKKASATCGESQTQLALMYSLASPYDAEYPLNQSDRRPPLHGVLTFKILTRIHLDFKKHCSIPRRELDQFPFDCSRVVLIYKRCLDDAPGLRAIEVSGCVTTTTCSPATAGGRPALALDKFVSFKTAGGRSHLFHADNINLDSPPLIPR
jgi:hypothetical protein